METQKEVSYSQLMRVGKTDRRWHGLWISMLMI